jgi:putative ABC transport system permease protein
MFMQRDVAQRLLGIGGTDAYLIQAEQGRREEVGQRLEALAEKYGVLLHSRTDVTRIIDRMVDGIEGSLWGLLVLGFVVAAFGVVNTLTMNVLEQTRELGLLRIVAMTRRQVRRTILVQAVIIGLIGLVPGTLAGLGVAYLMYLATLTTTGHAVQFVFRPELLLGSLLAALVIVIISAWGPAERAARLELGQALHYE